MSVKAGVVMVTRFISPQGDRSSFKGYIDYIDRPEAKKGRAPSGYGPYQDYMDDAEKTGGIFTEDKDSLTAEEKKALKDCMLRAYENNALMWQTVISFDDRWLISNGLLDPESGVLNEGMIMAATRLGVKKLLEKEDLTGALWSAAIHYNTDNKHVHVAITETDPVRKKRRVPVYADKEKKVPLLDEKGNQVFTEEYRGKFKYSSIESAKSAVVNQILKEKEVSAKIRGCIRVAMVGSVNRNGILGDEELAGMFMNIYMNLPDCDPKMWNYGSSVCEPLRGCLNAFTDKYLEIYCQEDKRALEALLTRQSEAYRSAYGDSDRDYMKNVRDDLYKRMGNAVLKQMRMIHRAGNKRTGDRYPGYFPERRFMNRQEKVLVKLAERYERHFDECDIIDTLCLYHAYLELGENERAIGVLERKADAGDRDAQFHLGLLYLKAEDWIRYYGTATDYLAMAASAGHEEAACILIYLDRHKAIKAVGGRKAAGLYNSHFARAWRDLKKSLDNTLEQKRNMEIYSRLSPDDPER